MPYIITDSRYTTPSLQFDEPQFWLIDIGWVPDQKCASVYDTNVGINLPIGGSWMEVTPRYARVRAMAELRQDNDGDDWGWAISWLFAICDELMFRRSLPVPAEWEFRPSPFGPDDSDEWKTSILDTFSDSQVQYCGNLLYRYTERLRRAGKDY